MILPISAEDSRAGLLAALAVGVAFGALLERAGLGSARRVAAQFQGRDLAVLKVMMSAIVTAALGVFWLARLGLLDPTRVYVPHTDLVPQAIGGIVFGAGMVVAGLCPGTACVSAATGRRDGVAVLGGLLLGVLAFAAVVPRVAPSLNGRDAAPLTFPELTGLPEGVLIAALVALALGALMVGERVERRFAEVER